jgi:DNA polymerase
MDTEINIEELLDWYMWAGVTETCSDAPCLMQDIQKFPSASVTTGNMPTNAPKPVIQSFADISKNARDICSSAKTLEELKELLLKFEGCNLKTTAASTVFGSGNPQAKIMLIGEAPGADEDRAGLPFVGKCGKLLDKILASIQLNREECYITNVLPWRPPGNRTPTDEEVALCLPFLKRQIELIRPEILLLLGGVSLKSVMDVNDSISRARGKWMEYSIDSDTKAAVLATYHPSYLLRNSAQKAKVWADFLRLKKKISEM